MFVKILPYYFYRVITTWKKVMLLFQLLYFINYTIHTYIFFSINILQCYFVFFPDADFRNCFCLKNFIEQTVFGSLLYDFVHMLAFSRVVSIIIK